MGTIRVFFPKTRELTFFECLIMQFFSSLTSNLRDTMPRQWSFTLLSRVMEEFPGGGNHSKHMPALRYLAWLQPIYYNSRFIFIHINVTKIFTCGENFDKKILFFFRFSFWIFLFFSGSLFENIVFFFRFSFWKYYFFSVSVFENIIVFLGSVFESIIFFQVQFLRIFLFSGTVFENIIFFQVQLLRIRLLSGSH